MDEDTKMDKVLDIWGQLLRTKNKNVSESTYVGLVELFMRNGLLSHASYFLCQMDRLELKIPRSLLDLFLDYSINNQLFDKKEEITFKNNNYENDKKNNRTSNTRNNESQGGQNSGQSWNKYDDYDPKNDPDYAYYFSKRNHYKQRGDIQNLFSNLKVDAKPFYPKEVEDKQFSAIKTKLSGIDPKTIKPYIPKNYQVNKKDDGQGSPQKNVIDEKTPNQEN